jgi:excisionase family DNA binding protein
MAVEGKDEALWTTEEVAAFLKVDTETVYRWIKAGDLPCVRVRRLFRFRPEDIRSIRDAGLPTEGAA